MSPCHRLTRREREVMALVAKGKRNRQIAEELVITEGTVEAHLHNIFQKLDVSTRTEASLLFTLTIGQANATLVARGTLDGVMVSVPNRVRPVRARHKQAL